MYCVITCSDFGHCVSQTWRELNYYYYYCVMEEENGRGMAVLLVLLELSLVFWVAGAGNGKFPNWRWDFLKTVMIEQYISIVIVYYY